MINAINSALSGLQSATKQIDASAGRIANVSGPNTDTVDLSEEAINLIVAETSYKANLAALKTANELNDELLRLFDRTS